MSPCGTNLTDATLNLPLRGEKTPILLTSRRESVGDGCIVLARATHGQGAPAVGSQSIATRKGGSEERRAVRSLEEVRGTWGRRSSLAISRVDLGQSLVQDKKQLHTKGFCHKAANVPPL